MDGLPRATLGVALHFLLVCLLGAPLLLFALLQMHSVVDSQLACPVGLSPSTGHGGCRAAGLLGYYPHACWALLLALWCFMLLYVIVECALPGTFRNLPGSFSDLRASLSSIRRYLERHIDFLVAGLSAQQARARAVTGNGGSSSSVAGFTAGLGGAGAQQPAPPPAADSGGLFSGLMGGGSAVAEAPPPPARLAPTDLFPERSPQQPSPPLGRPPHAPTRVSKARRLLVRLRSHWLFTGTFALLMASVLYLSLVAATLFVMYVVLGAAVEPQRMLPVLLSVVALLVLGRQVRPTTLTPIEPSHLSRPSPLPPRPQPRIS